MADASSEVGQLSLLGSVLPLLAPLLALAVAIAICCREEDGNEQDHVAYSDLESAAHAAAMTRRLSEQEQERAARIAALEEKRRKSKENKVKK